MEHELWVGARFVVLRDSVPYCELKAAADGGHTVSWDSDARIKLSFTGTFETPETEVDFLRDRLCPTLLLNGEPHALGRYVMTSPQAASNAARDTVQLTCYDVTYLCELSKLAQRKFFAAGTLYTTAISVLLVESGIVDMLIVPNTAVLATDREDWEPGTDRLTIINQLLSEMCYESLWADLAGVVHVAPRVQPSAETVTLRYADGADSLLLPEISGSSDTFDLANVFIREVDNPDLGTVLRAVARNDDPNSPAGTVRRGMEVVDYETLDNIASAQHLQNYVNNLALASRMATQVVQFGTAQAVHAPFEVLELRRGAVHGIYLETAWRLPMTAATAMEHTAQRSVLEE